MQVHEAYENIRDKALPQAALVIGGVSEKAQIQGLRAGTGFVIATPGRLQDLIDRRFADLRHIKMLVLDEADRMLDMGFLPAIRRILALLPKTSSDPVLLGHARKPPSPDWCMNTCAIPSASLWVRF